LPLFIQIFYYCTVSTLANRGLDNNTNKKSKLEVFIMTWENRITVDPAVLVGKPVIKGTRLAVEFIVGLLAQGWSEEEVLRNYPDIKREDILACLAYAQERLQDERVNPLPN
jgi:uncharacterized protein (DUF433 family)